MFAVFVEVFRSNGRPSGRVWAAIEEPSTGEDWVMVASNFETEAEADQWAYENDPIETDERGYSQWAN